MGVTPKRAAESATEMVQVVLPNDANPLGQYVLIGNAPFLVIGVLAILLAIAIWYRLLRARSRRPPT